MKKNLTQHLILTVAIILFSMDMFSQKLPNDSIMMMNRRYKNEIGIDFQGIFKGTLGSALIWKHKKVGRLISLAFTENYRFQLALAGNVPLTQKSTQQDTTKLGQYLGKQPSNFSISPMFGIERVNFFGRFNMYYGMDMGPFYNYFYSGYNYYTYRTNGYFYNGSNISKSSSLGLAAIPFFGVKYRFAEHFSVSVESGFAVRYAFTKTFYFLYYNNNNTNNYTKLVTVTKVNGFSFNMMYLRLLTFNYHF